MRMIIADESWFFLWYGTDGFLSSDGWGEKRPENNLLSIGMKKIFLEHKKAVNSIKDIISSYIFRLHMDNGKIHNSIIPQQKMNELDIERLPHPPNYPDISQNDFFLYGYLKNKLKRKIFCPMRRVSNCSSWNYNK